MPETTHTVTFPEDLASKILWSPNVAHESGRSSRASYVLVAPDSQSGVSSPAVTDLESDNNVPAPTSNVPAAIVSPTVIESTATLDDATAPINIDVVSADDSAPSVEETVPGGGEVIPELSSSIREEIKAHISYKFSIDVQMESVKSHKAYVTKSHSSRKPRRMIFSATERIIEPLIHICCPHAGCHEVIDEALRGVAKDEGAEVLTLDALELSLSADAGILGAQIYEALSNLYKDPIRPSYEEESSESSETEDTTDSDDDDDTDCDDFSDEDTRKRSKERKERRKAAAQRKEKAQREREKKNKVERDRKDAAIQAVFDALISLSSSESPQKRVIYIRDFGSIAKVSSPLIVRLLRAIHARRVGKFSEGMESEDLIQPTLLVLGYSNATSTNNIAESTFIRSGEALRNALPHIGEDTLKDGLTSISLSPIGSRFFLHSMVVRKGEEDDESDDSDDSDSDDLFGFMWPPRRQTMTNDPSSSVTTTTCTTFDGPFYSLNSFDLSSASLALSIFFTGAEKKVFSSLEKSLCERRKADMANTWFKLLLIQRKRRLVSDDVVGYLEDDNDLQKDLVEEKEKDDKTKKQPCGRFPPRRGHWKSKKSSKNSSEPRGPYKGQYLLARLSEVLDCSIPVALDSAVAIVLGLTNRGQTSDVPQVPLSVFPKAFRMLIHNHKSRIALGKKEKDSKEDQNDKENDDPVVKSVKDADDLTGHERKLLPCIVDPNELTTAFEDVCISEKTIESLRTIISLRLKFPGAFASGVLGRESMGGVLLYGPPGTGKTMACRAVARECGARMLVIKPSDIMDCYVGESEKLVKAIFSLAYRLAPCLIFVDELDSTFGKRKEDDKKWVRDILAEFLQSMDGLKSAKKNKDAGVILIGATNRPQDIDEAVIRRLPSRMMVDAPDETQRQRILELHLRGETLDKDVKLNEIAAKTNNYSGSDLKNLCVAAAMASVKEAIGAFTWEPISSKDVPKAGDSNDETDLAKEKVDKRTVKMKHILDALSEVPGSLASGLLGQSELQRWHNQYGAGASSRPTYGARPGGYTGLGSYGSKPGTGSTTSTGGSTTGAGGSGYGVGGGTGGYGLGANRYGAGSGSSYNSGILGSGAGTGGVNQPSGETRAGTGAPPSASSNTSSTPSVPRYPYGANAGGGLGLGAGRYGSNPNSETSSAGQNLGGYPRYGAQGECSGILGGEGSAAGLSRYNSVLGGYGGGIRSGGVGTETGGDLGIEGVNGVLGGLGGGILGTGGITSDSQGPSASIEEVGDSQT